MQLTEYEKIANRVPPQNLEAEQSVLGAILLDKEALFKVMEILSPEDFYREAHRKIFTAMIELSEKGEVIDLISLKDHLQMKKELESVGGVSYLSSLVASVPTAANVSHHARIIREKALMRGLINAATKVVEMVYDGGLPADEMVDEAEKTIFHVSDKRITTSFAKMKDLIKDSFQMIEDLYDSKKAITGVPSGYSDLDRYTTGFQKGDLIIIGGRPSIGKTTFALNIAQHVAIDLGEPVAIFSLEMSNRSLAIRMLCSEAMVDANKVRSGFISKEDWHKLTTAAGRLAEAPIYIDDTSNLSVLEMRAKARRLKLEKGSLSLIIVDYLQLMKGRGQYERRDLEISDISRSLKALAKELEVPVLALSQLNRDVEKRSDKKPTLADLRESGAIEQDADVILFLYREEGSRKKDAEQDNVIIADIAKQRNGPQAKVKLTFLPHCTRFVDYTDEIIYEEDEEAF
ncbi:MAG: replicative DNA helicase [Nitrospirae bacterium]|nr:MAG: replicative DNA helicase [Nitrospirota bacterium]